LRQLAGWIAIAGLHSREKDLARDVVLFQQISKAPHISVCALASNS
jgi:hypothetical protein